MIVPVLVSLLLGLATTWPQPGHAQSGWEPLLRQATTLADPPLQKERLRERAHTFFEALKAPDTARLRDHIAGPQALEQIIMETQGGWGQDVDSAEIRARLRQQQQVVQQAPQSWQKVRDKLQAQGMAPGQMQLQQIVLGMRIDDWRISADVYYEIKRPGGGEPLVLKAIAGKVGSEWYFGAVPELLMEQ
jgi:hypothetical protein